MIYQNKSNGHGCQFTIVIPDGDPSHFKIIKHSNWLGKGIVITRSYYEKAKFMPEIKEALSYPGVYILVNDISLKAYVGEGDPTLNRLDSHFRNKEKEYNKIICFSKDSLDKARIKFLESRLIELIKNSGIYKLENKMEPSPPFLSDANLGELEDFIEYIKICLSTLGINIIEPPLKNESVPIVHYKSARVIPMNELARLELLEKETDIKPKQRISRRKITGDDRIKCTIECAEALWTLRNTADGKFDTGSIRIPLQSYLPNLNLSNGQEARNIINILINANTIIKDNDKLKNHRGRFADDIKEFETVEQRIIGYYEVNPDTNI